MTVAEILNNIATAKDRIKEIHSVIHTDVTGDVNLSELDSTSKTAEFSLWESVVTIISYIQEQLFNERKAEVQAIVDENISPNSLWLSHKIKEFQYGDTLQLNDQGKPYYAVIDEGKQIVKYVSIIEENGFYTAKVAKDNAGDPAVLVTDELNALNTYLNNLVLGNNGLATTKAADIAQVNYTIYYNAIRSEATVRNDVEEAIRSYLAELDFRGNMYLSKLEDAIQKVADVVDFEREGVLARTAESETFSEVTRKYNPDAGYIEIDPAKQLSETLTFVAV